MKIAIASDHAGVGYKIQLVNHLKTKGVEIKDFGPMNEESVDYPDYVTVANVIEKDADIGILLCGSGNGINMSANKHQAIRSALC